LSAYLKGVDVNEGLNFRTVSVQTEAVVPAAFMRLVGVNSLTAVANATAEERYSKVEVALILDLSNSMNSFSRIETWLEGVFSSEADAKAYIEEHRQND
jgi:hypothetical protein